MDSTLVLTLDLCVHTGRKDSVAQGLVHSDGLWYKYSWLCVVFHHLATCCEQEAVVSALSVAVLPGMTPRCYPKYCYIIVHQHNTNEESRQNLLLRHTEQSSD